VREACREAVQLFHDSVTGKNSAIASGKSYRMRVHVVTECLRDSLKGRVETIPVSALLATDD
jgi:hypothetical protein